MKLQRARQSETDRDTMLGVSRGDSRNIKADAQGIHLEPPNAGSVFQAASQFNCLEMVGPGVCPEEGVTAYGRFRAERDTVDRGNSN